MADDALARADRLIEALLLANAKENMAELMALS